MGHRETLHYKAKWRQNLIAFIKQKWVALFTSLTEKNNSLIDIQVKTVCIYNCWHYENLWWKEIHKYCHLNSITNSTTH